jgi:dCTP deaminase
MILSDTRILEEMEKGTIKVTPYNRDCLGSNSYDVHLGKTLATYKEHMIDAKKRSIILKSRTKGSCSIHIYSTWV